MSYHGNKTPDDLSLHCKVKDLLSRSLNSKTLHSEQTGFLLCVRNTNGKYNHIRFNFKMQRGNQWGLPVCKKPPCGVGGHWAWPLGMLCLQSLSIVIGQLLDGSLLDVVSGCSTETQGAGQRNTVLDLWVVLTARNRVSQEVCRWSLVVRVRAWHA